jgi:hypothetical protein
MPIADSLARLRESAARFNKVTDTFNDTIAAVEDELARIGVGLTVWLEETQQLISVENWGSGGNHDRARAKALGYTKLDEGWCLAVKPVVWVRGLADGDENCPWEELRDDGTPVALLKAPRLVRVEAAQHLENLLDALADHADHLVGSVEAAHGKVVAAISSDAVDVIDGAQVIVTRKGKRTRLTEEDVAMIRAREKAPDSDVR